MDSRIHAIQMAIKQREVDRANERRNHYLPDPKPVDTRKGRKKCPECSATIMSSASSCSECSVVFWERVNGVNVYKKGASGRRQCPQCGGWLNCYEPACGCGHHFELLAAEFKVRVVLPQGVSVDQMAKYICQSVQSACGGLSPDDSLFNLDREGVVVKHITPTENARKAAKPLSLV